jgi:hypothetical protein
MSQMWEEMQGAETVVFDLERREHQERRVHTSSLFETEGLSLTEVENG